jgi:hypothetical protein
VESGVERLPSYARGLLLSLLLAMVHGGYSDAQSQPFSGTNSVGFGSVVGRVTQEGRPAAYANIIVIGTRRGIPTRDDGSFRLDGLPAGPTVLLFQMIGCTKASVSVEVKPGITDTVSVDLQCPLTGCFRQDHFVADCYRPNEEERRRVGSRCRVHASVVLVSDTVRIGYGLQIVRPGFSAAENDSFPNARDWWDGGCVLEKWAFTEVAYCNECRRAHERWLQRTVGRR